MNHKGYTLIEVIVTMLIVAILLGGASLGYGRYKAVEAENALEKLASSIDITRATTKACANEVELVIYFKNDKYYADIIEYNQYKDDYNILNSTSICSKELKLSYKETQYSTEFKEITENTKKTIKFNRITDGFTVDTYCYCFKVNHSSAKNLYLAYETGKTYLE